MRTVLPLVALLALAVTLLASASPATRTAASPPPANVTYTPKKKAPVVFRHSTHVKAGTCAACHPKPFEKVAHATRFTMNDISAGHACGSCHNGRTAFAVRSCTRCHVAGAPAKSSQPGCGGDCGNCKGCPK